MKKKNERTVRLILSALLAAIYVLLSLLAESAGLFRYAIQLRIPEALSVLSAFTSAALPGVTLGCFLSGLLLGAAPLDLIFGTLASFIGVIIGRALTRGRRKSTSVLFLSTVPTLIANTLIMPPVIAYSYGLSFALPLAYLVFFIGELVSACVLGTLLGRSLLRIRGLQI